VGLCQLLPGPTSSQVGFLIGHHRAGWPGALSAWVGFTLPSALLMYAFAVLVPQTPGPLIQAVLHGLMLTAVAVVAQAVWSMGRNLCPDRERTAIGAAGAVPAVPQQRRNAIHRHADGRDRRLDSVPEITLPAVAWPAGVDFRIAWIALVVFVGYCLRCPLWQRSIRTGRLPSPTSSTVQGRSSSGAAMSTTALTGSTRTERMGFRRRISGWLRARSGKCRAALHGRGVSWRGECTGARICTVGDRGAGCDIPPRLAAGDRGAVTWSRLGARETGLRRSLLVSTQSVVGILGAALYNPVWVSGVRSRC